MLKYLSLCMVVGMSTAVAQPTMTVSDKARELAHRYLVVDGHIDVPYRLEEKWVDVTQATEGGDFDYPRAVAGRAQRTVYVNLCARCTGRLASLYRLST